MIVDGVADGKCGREDRTWYQEVNAAPWILSLILKDRRGPHLTVQWLNYDSLPNMMPQLASDGVQLLPPFYFKTPSPSHFPALMCAPSLIFCRGVLISSHPHRPIIYAGVGTVA